IARQEDSAWMRICMENPIDQDLVQVSAKEFFSQGASVQIQARQRRKLCDFYPFNELHRQNLPRRIVRNGLGDAHALKLPQITAKDQHVGRLTPVIELMSHCMLKLL